MQCLTFEYLRMSFAFLEESNFFRSCSKYFPLRRSLYAFLLKSKFCQKSTSSVLVLVKAVALLIALARFTNHLHLQRVRRSYRRYHHHSQFIPAPGLPLPFSLFIFPKLANGEVLCFSLGMGLSALRGRATSTSDVVARGGRPSW